VKAQTLAAPKMADFYRRRVGAGLEPKRTRAVLPEWKEDDGGEHCHSAGLAPSKPTRLFTADCVLPTTTNASYDVSRDGRRFLMVQPSARESATPTQIIVVLNWHEELKRLVPN
jgi:hypothetical protein